MNSEYIDSQLIFEFFNVLNQSKVQYVLIKNIGQELPYRLKDGKDIDILVAIEDRYKLVESMLAAGFLKRIPPLGVENGYHFGYQLPEYQFWQKAGIMQTFYIDVCFKLMCKSLMPKYWIPLDGTINKRVWEEKVWNEELKCWQIDEKTLLVYLLVRCVFDKHSFSDIYIEEIEKRKQWIYEDEIQKMLHTVFYRFTPKISEMVTMRKYDSIMENYIRFTDY